MADTFILALSDPNTSSEKIKLDLINELTNDRSHLLLPNLPIIEVERPEKVKEIHLDTRSSIIHAGTDSHYCSLSNNIQINSLKAILLSRYDINLSSISVLCFQDRANRINRYSSVPGITMVLRVRHFCLGKVSRFSNAEDFVTAIIGNLTIIYCKCP